MATDLTSLLEGGVILDPVAADSRKQALTLLSQALAAKTKLDQRDIFEAVLERERLGSTGVGEGVAIPHARIDRLSKPLGGFVRLESGVDFDAVDERPCDLIFMLIAPVGSGADHLRALAQVSRTLRQPSVREALRQAKDKAEIRKILCPEAAKASAA
ncbi:MAG: transcriptional regulator [Hyphomonadaceae bacterium]|uniref:PTS sugar transporter subunit IIA n=1 Tax=Henriciella sp. TaxID=1968823 RepID=UPI000C1049CD|nr:PTS sugar transporter subunit IIA [Henriciella sp.]MBF33388.1 transcriptional regulator [Hyphomonadaceae bacterium]PHR82663.1 MAG: transcriptional regulator [Henriciella sp.]